MSISNWKKIKSEDLPGYNSRGEIYTDINSGIELLHISNDDPEIFFSFILNTPPHDNKGIPHIIEHCVFCGSHKYRIRDPFIALSSGSVNTFYNAMTYPDMTLYPFASAVAKDFFNILDIYSDAVFNPLLKRGAFLQEGRRYQKGRSGKTEINGVVYNEMLGSYSMHETIVSENSCRRLFTESSSKYDSGGVPENIARLEYDEMIEYYRKYYTGSNCRCFLYGNIDVKEVLSYLNNTAAATSSFSAEALTGYSQEKKWKFPRNIHVPGPGDSGISSTVNWLIGKSSDPQYLMKMELLCEILLGNHSSPLYKALADSGLGMDLSSASGIESDLYEMTFTAGLRGLQSTEQAREIRDLVFRCLEKTAEKGIDPDILSSSLARYEFRKREIRGGYPYGFRLLSRCMKSWCRGEDPLKALKLDELFAGLKRSIRQKRFLEKTIETEFLGNSHYSVLTVYPSSSFSITAGNGRKREHDENAERCLSESREFTAYKNTRDRKSDIAKIPSLEISDIPGKILSDNITKKKQGRADLFVNETNTNGIVYLDLAFSAGSVPTGMMNYIPLLSRIICTTGTAKRSEEKVSSDINMYTGGIYLFTECSEVPGTGNTLNSLFIRVPALARNVQKAAELVCDILADTQIENNSHLKKIILEQRNDFASSILPYGNTFASISSAAMISSVLKQEDEWRGIDQYLFLEKLKMREAYENLAGLPDLFFRSGGLSVQVSARQEDLAEGLEAAKQIISVLDRDTAGTGSNKAASYTPESGIRLFESESNVAFSALSVPCPKIGSELHAESLVIAYYLSNEELWNRIRIRQGAYGASASISGTEGIFTFSSFRDPDPGNSFRIYKDSVRKLAANGIKQSVIDKTVITLCGNEFKPLVPEESSLLEFRRKLYNIGSELRQQKIEALKQVSENSLKIAAQRLYGAMYSPAKVLIGNAGHLSGIRTKKEINAVKLRVI